MTDRELLEAAARAAGIPKRVVGSSDSCVLIDGRLWDGWNPLTDDGDALRLMAQLRLEVFYETNSTVTVRQWFDGAIRAEVDECDADVAAATRRAIVRAAAAIATAKEPQ